MTQSTIEQLDQVYQIPRGGAIPWVDVKPNVSMIMLRGGSFWDGTLDGEPDNPITQKVDLVADTAVQIITSGNTLKGVRIVNYGLFPVYIGVADPVDYDPPSDFIPPAQMDGSVLWPSQYQFPFSPVGNWYLQSPGDVSVTLITW